MGAKSIGGQVIAGMPLDDFDIRQAGAVRPISDFLSGATPASLGVTAPVRLAA